MSNKFKFCTEFFLLFLHWTWLNVKPRPISTRSANLWFDVYIRYINKSVRWSFFHIRLTLHCVLDFLKLIPLFAAHRSWIALFAVNIYWCKQLAKCFQCAIFTVDAVLIEGGEQQQAEVHNWHRNICSIECVACR